MIYREAIDENKLFRQFDNLADFEGVSKSEIQVLKGLVLDVADRVEPFIECIQLTFKQYTKHDLQHLLNIADHIHDFLPRQKTKKNAIRLNAVELTCVWLAIMLHDVGMFVSDAEEKQEFLDSDDYRSHCRHHRDRLYLAVESEKTGNTVKSEAIRDAIFAEFIRQRHAQRVHAFIDKHLAGKLCFRGMDLSKDIGFLCESHNWGVRQSRDSRHPERCVLKMRTADLVGRTRVNYRYLACCLRLGDIVDFDRTRTPLSAFHSIHFTESTSVGEWNKHLSIKGVTVSEQRIEYVADCKTPADYVAVHHFLDWVDRELQEATRIVLDFSQELKDRYQLNIAPVVSRHQVKMADPRFVAGGFRFQLEYDPIIRLLMDKSLYPDESMFLRELLQNALDACRYQQARAEEKKKEKKTINYTPRIQVWDGTGLTRNPSFPNDGTRIEFRDNGVGMSLDQVENFFMRIGKSFYRSSDFLAERERLGELGIHLDACSRFGIGFLSCFLGGDRIVVETFQYGSRPLRITIEGQLRYFVIEQLAEVDLASFPAFCSPEDPMDDSPPYYSGTKITVYFRENWRRNPSMDDDDLVFKTLDKYAVNQEFPIYISGSKKDTRTITERRWDSQTPSPTLSYNITKRREHSTIVHEIWLNRLKPSAFKLADYHDQLRGRGAIWFLADHYGNPVTQCGELRIEGGSIQQSTIVKAVRKIIHHDERAKIVTWMQRISSGSQQPPINLHDWERQLGIRQRGSISLSSSDLNVLVSGDLLWAIQTAQAASLSQTPWYECADEIEALWNGDLGVLASLWETNKCGRPEFAALTIDATYKLALFGIESPGGFQSWDAAKGIAERHNWLPAQGLTIAIDTFGVFSPEPAASRLFIPNERGNEVRGAVSMAFLRHSKKLTLDHSESEMWLEWFRAFLESWGATSCLVPSQVREFAVELDREDLLPDVSNGLWVGAAATHSAFGKVVLTKYTNGYAPYLDVTQPIALEHIEAAASKSGVSSEQIAAAVESLSDYLGWDITKGYRHAVS